MSNAKAEEIETSSYKSVKIELLRHEDRFSRPSYGYRLPSGAWGAGLGTKRGALVAARRAIRGGKR